jgi:hypothetical protein
MVGEKGKRRKRRPKRDNPAQSRKFIEAAKSLGVDEKAFQRALEKIIPKKRTGGNS